MNKIINLVLSGLLWRRYKFLLVSLVLTIVFMVIVGQVHQDYLRYNEMLEQPKFVGWSFAIKWGVWVLALSLFLFANHWYNEKKQAQKDKENEGHNSALKKLLHRVSGKTTAGATQNAKQKATQNNKDEEARASTSKQAGAARQGQDKENSDKDPFAELRNKDKLRSYAELIIDKKQTKH